jgi:alpha-glucosidase
VAGRIWNTVGSIEDTLSGQKRRRGKNEVGLRRWAFAAIITNAAAIILVRDLRELHDDEGTVRAPWWQTAVIYQIYPRSFQDSNGDGIGDLPGITRHLPYLRELGVDAIWISPIFPSPMADFGYDISDYTGIDPLFGTLSDFDTMLAAAHALGIRVLLDLVPNHTSDQHPWFVESRASRNSRKRQWYLWRDPAPGGGPPNNWLSEFGGSAWQLDPRSGQFYYHAFLAAQPDLNWRNPQVPAAIHDVMRFWLRRRVDGFRVDVIWHLLKDDQFRDNPENPRFEPGQPPHRRLVPLYTADLPGVHEIIWGLRAVIDEFDDRLLIGEIYLPIERLMAYYGEDLGGVHLPFNFALLETPWDARVIANRILEYEVALPAGGWPNWVLGNHDRPRIASRVGRAQARIAAMLLLTLRGTPTLYYGDEIGMQQVAIPPERVRDPFEKNVPGLDLGRDGGRTPMQWNGAPFAGFSETEPWLPVADDAGTVNVADQRRDARSLLNLYRDLIQLRRSHRALQFGAYRPIEASGDLLVFARELPAERLVVALNLGTARFRLGSAGLAGRIIASSRGDRRGETMRDAFELHEDEGLVIELAGDAQAPAGIDAILVRAGDQVASGSTSG